MLQRLTIDGIDFPRLYIAEDNSDVELAKANGIPYIKWKHGKEQLIKSLLRPTLEKLFPGLKWNSILGPRKPIRNKIILQPGYIDGSDHFIAEHDNERMLNDQYAYDKIVKNIDHNYDQNFNANGEHERETGIAISERDCCNNGGPGQSIFVPDSISVFDYIGDLSSSVDIEALNKLGLLPAFVGKVYDIVKLNRSQSMQWTEGYNKKRGACIGNFNRQNQLPNLIILDISYSIPDGIAATMITLIATLCANCNAELIITSARSGYYPIGAEIPSPQTIRDYYGRSNESAEFMAILESKIAGREFGHVISFGDDDNPGRIYQHWNRGKQKKIDLSGTRVHEVHHFHTTCRNTPTGYARWVKEACPNVIEHFDTSWCSYANKKYRM